MHCTHISGYHSVFRKYGQGSYAGNTFKNCIYEKTSFSKSSRIEVHLFLPQCESLQNHRISEVSFAFDLIIKIWVSSDLVYIVTKFWEINHYEDWKHCFNYFRYQILEIKRCKHVSLRANFWFYFLVVSLAWSKQVQIFIILPNVFYYSFLSQVKKRKATSSVLAADVKIAVQRLLRSWCGDL